MLNARAVELIGKSGARPMRPRNFRAGHKISARLATAGPRRRRAGNIVVPPRSTCSTIMRGLPVRTRARDS